MSEQDEPSARLPFFSALRHRDFALLWSGQFVSQLGDGIFTVALALETLQISDRPSSLGFVLAARTLPAAVLALIGGALADRIPRRLAMLGSDTVRGLVVGAVAVLIASGAARLWQLVALSLVFGTADALFRPAVLSIIPELLPDKLLVQGNALRQTSMLLAESLIGPSVGGLIVGLAGTAWSFGIDAISFAVSVTCLILLSGGGSQRSTDSSLLADAVAGLRFMISRRWLILTIAAAGACNLFGLATFIVLIPLLVRHTLHGSALALGLVLAAGGAGGAVGGLVAGRVGRPRRRIVVMWTAWGLSGLAAIGLAVSASTWTVGILGAIVFGLEAYGDVLFYSLVQAEVPQEMSGRTFAFVQLLGFGMMPAGTVLAGFLGNYLGIRETLALCAAASAIPAFVVFLPHSRDPDRRSGPRRGPSGNKAAAGDEAPAAGDEAPAGD
jgi:MFS family permease